MAFLQMSLPKVDENAESFELLNKLPHRDHTVRLHFLKPYNSCLFLHLRYRTRAIVPSMTLLWVDAHRTKLGSYFSVSQRSFPPCWDCCSYFRYG